MTQYFLRASASPSMRRSRSPASAASTILAVPGLAATGLTAIDLVVTEDLVVTDLAGGGAMRASASATRALPLPLRQNARRMAHSDKRHGSTRNHQVPYFRSYDKPRRKREANFVRQG